MHLYDSIYTSIRHKQSSPGVKRNRLSDGSLKDSVRRLLHLEHNWALPSLGIMSKGIVAVMELRPVSFSLIWTDSAAAIKRWDHLASSGPDRSQILMNGPDDVSTVSITCSPDEMTKAEAKKNLLSGCFLFLPADPVIKISFSVGQNAFPFESLFGR